MKKARIVKKIRMGSRASRLALAQVEEITSFLRKRNIRFPYEVIMYKTKGDLDKKTPLSDNPPDDFFTDSLDEAILKGEIDVAVHSAKDLPKDLKKGLSIFALTKSPDETDAFVGHVKISELKEKARVGTSSSVRKTAIEDLNPRITTVDIRGTIEERIALVDEGRIDGVIVATCALKRLGLAHRIKDILPYEATPLQGQLAVVGRENDAALEKIFKSMDIRIRYCTVFLVGAGPGDTELLTVKAIRILKSAHVVFYDYLIDKKLLKYAPKAEKIYVGKRKGDHALSQAQLNRMLRQNAMTGKITVRLKGGDPLVFGRGADEIEYLRSYHIPVEVIPGVSSATGIPSNLGIPLTARSISSSVAFLSGHDEDEKNKIKQLIKIPAVDTLVFLMGLTKLDVIIKSLKQAVWKGNTPVIIISKGTRPEERIVCGDIDTIEEITAREHLEPPALIIVG